MRALRVLGLNCVARANQTAAADDCHYACLPQQLAVGRPTEACLEQTGAKPFELRTGIAQAGDLYDRNGADLEQRALRERQEIQPTRENVLTHVAGMDVEPSSVELVMQFGVNEVDLTEIRLVRVLRDAREVLDGSASMRVTFDAETFDQANFWFGLLDEVVAAGAADREDGCGHGRSANGSNATMMSCRRSGRS